MSLPTPRTPTLVLVDDVVEIRRMLRRALERRGDFRVVAEAGSGEEGIGLVTRHRPDAVLLDLAMPAMNRPTALPLLREASPRTKVVVVSGFGADLMADHVRDLGAAGYLRKGAPVRELLAGLAALLAADEAVPGEARADTRVVRQQAARAAVVHARRERTPTPSTTGVL